MKVKAIKLGEDNPVSAITDWYMLGNVLGVTPKIMAYALKNRDSLQKRISIKDRVVYKSAPSLKFVQTRLRELLEILFDDAKNTECAIAYRKGIRATEVISGLTGSDVLITLDIRHFYDTVTLGHIERALEEFGFCQAGARLAGRYCLVKNDHGKHSLQQGCAASPVVSNMVGNVFFDRPIQKWLKEHCGEGKFTYLRYCDNLAVFLHYTPEPELTEEFKKFLKGRLREDGFTSHKWNTVSGHHPKMHQKFLGVVLNSAAKVERSRIDNLRAALWNWCMRGTLDVYSNLCHEAGHFQYFNIGASEKRVSVQRIMRGHIIYVGGINQRHKLWLEKLYAAATYLDSVRVCAEHRPELRKALSAYRSSGQVASYLEAVKKVVES